jgi:hypothetical protein
MPANYEMILRMSRVEIADVTPVERESGELLASAIDAPKPGDRRVGYALDIRGWVVARDRRATAAEIMQDGALVRRVPVDDERPDVAEAFPDVDGAGRAGFFATIGALNLPPEFELLVRARLEDKTRVPFAKIAGRRTELRTTFDPLLEPIALTTLGRTGSTAIVRLLGSHPEIVAYRPFEYEPRVATYWIDALRTLSDPAASRRQITPSGPIEGNWWVSKDPPLPGRIKDREIQDWLGGESVEEIAAFCQSRIDALYAKVGTLLDRPDASYFVEKFRPDAVPALVAELYPRSCEIVLVRDFRDMAASMFAFNEKRGFQGFRRDRSESDADYLVERVGPSAAALAAAWSSRSASAQLLRYEDFVQRPQETVAELLDYLGLDDSSTTIKRMLKAVGGPDTEGHRTVADPGESIGRWRRDLSPELQEACIVALGPSLEAFGYTDG